MIFSPEGVVEDSSPDVAELLSSVFDEDDVLPDVDDVALLLLQAASETAVLAARIPASSSLLSCDNFLSGRTVLSHWSLVDS